MCQIVFRPFYGWMPYFYKKTLFETFHAIYEHGSEWCLVFSMLFAIVNLPLDVYVAYLYFFEKFYFLYQPETYVQRSFAALTLVSVFIFIAFIWCTGKGLLTIVDKKSVKISPENKSERVNEVLVDDEKDEKVQEITESSRGDDQSNLSQSTALQDIVTSSKVSSNSTNSETLQIFMYFNFFCYAVYLTAVGPGQLYLLYFYIIRCTVKKDLVITTKLILAGYLLPFFICCIISKDIYKVLSRSWKLRCMKPILLTVASLTIVSGMAAAWLAALSLHATSTIAVNEVTGDSPAYKNGSKSLALILHSTEETSFHLTYASEVLEKANSFVNIQYDCSKNSNSRMKSECTNVEFYFKYIPTTKEIIFDYNVTYKNNTTSPNMKITQMIGWSCDLCGSSNKLRHDKATNNDNPIIEFYYDNMKVENCDQTPQWLFYALTACTFTIIIAYIVLLTQALLVKSKNKIRAAEEEDGIRFTKSLSILDRKLHQIKEDKAEESTTEDTVQQRKSQSQTSFRDVVKAASMHSVTTGSAINPKMDMGMAAMLAYKRRKIIRVPKGTTRSLGKIDMK